MVDTLAISMELTNTMDPFKIPKYILIAISLGLIGIGYLLTTSEYDAAQRVKLAKVRISDVYLCDELGVQIATMPQLPELTLDIHDMPSVLALCGIVYSEYPPTPLMFALSGEGRQVAISGSSLHLDNGAFQEVLLRDTRLVPGRYTIVIVYNHLTLDYARFFL
jgi:hypothetical protein